MTIGTGLRKKQKKKRGLAVVLVIFVLIGIAASWRLFDVSGAVEKLKAYFSTAAIRSGSGDSIRGTIYDRTYKEMAVSLPRVSVFARPREMQSVEAAAGALAPILGVDEDSLLEKLRGEELRIWLTRDISQKQEDAVRAAKLQGIYLHKEYSRYYPLKEVAAHLVGFVQDDIGLSGVEYYYDRLVQKMLGQSGSSEFRGSAGQNVLLTIDLKVQSILEKLVENIAAGRQNVRIGAYAMDAGSGALIASVQRPSFDPNRYRIYSQPLLENLLVRPMLLPPLYRTILRDSAAIQSQYESRGQVHPWSVSAQQLSLGSELRLWERLRFNAGVPQDFGNHESQSVKTTDYYVVTPPDTQDFGTVPESLSPLALLAAMSALTNGGGKVEPYVVQAVTDPASDDEFHLHPETHGRSSVEVISRESSKEISKMISTLGKASKLGGTILHDGIQVGVSNTDGFAHMSNDLYFAAVPTEQAELTVLLTIQGGNRQVQKENGESQADPAEELASVLPRIAVLQEVGKSIVDVAEPEEGKSGNYPMHLDRVREVVRSSLNQDDELADPGDMPDLVGLSLRKSLRLLQHATCRILIYGTGRVVTQQPASGTPLAGVKECVIRMQKQEDVSLEALEEKTSERK